MPNHNQNGGRNALPEDHQPSWRPQDDAPERRGRYPDRYAADDERAWRDRGFGGEEWRPSTREPRRWDPGERGHGHGDRYGDQRLQQLQDRLGRDDPMPSPGSFEDRYRDMGRDLGIDDRGTARDRGTYWADRPGSDAARDGYRGRDFEPERRGLSRGHHEERMGYPTAARGRGDERMGYAAGSYGRGYGGSGSTGPEPHLHRGTGPHRGKGPAGYQRSDDRIRELVCESLTDDDQIDASQVEVAVRHGEVTLSGRVDDRGAKREAEDCAWSVAGVRDVQNQLRVRGAPAADNPPGASAVGTSETETSAPDRKHRS